MPMIKSKLLWGDQSSWVLNFMYFNTALEIKSYEKTLSMSVREIESPIKTCSDLPSS